MAYSPIVFKEFGKGLNLRDKTDVLTSDEAIDLLNVVFTEHGSIRQRDGYGKFTGSALTNTVDSLGVYYTSAGTKQLVAGCGTRLEGINTSGTVVASATGLSGGPYTFARFGSPGNELVYAGNGTDTIRKWDGSSWTAPTCTVDGVAGKDMPKGGCIAVQPLDNRLVVSGFATTTGGPNATTTNPSRVYFSNPGLPETWETDGSAPRGANFLDLVPGDGEAIMGMITWRNMLFVFKETKYFVFHGNSVASTGTPIFNYRMVDTRIGLCSRRALCAGYDGVYFMNRSGVWKTTGNNDPELVSDVIDPFFIGAPSAYYRSNVLNQGALTQACMAFHENHVYLSVPTGSSSTNDTTLVYDPKFKWWTLWNIAASALQSFRISNQAELCFGFAAGTKDIGRYSSAYTNDNGTAITSRWRSGWADLNIPTIKTVREFKLWGTGKVSTLLSADYPTAGGVPTPVSFGAITTDTWADGTNAADKWGDGSGPDLWGPALQISPRLVRQAVRGSVFSFEFSNSTVDTAWSISRVALHVREKRMATILTTDR